MGKNSIITAHSCSLHSVMILYCRYGDSDPLEGNKSIIAKDPFDTADKPGTPEITDWDKVGSFLVPSWFHRQLVPSWFEIAGTMAPSWFIPGFILVRSTLLAGPRRSAVDASLGRRRCAHRGIPGGVQGWPRGRLDRRTAGI